MASLVILAEAGALSVLMYLLASRHQAHRDLVEHRRWISDGRFRHALKFCVLLPGPEAQQLATYIGTGLLHQSGKGLLQVACSCCRRRQDGSIMVTALPPRPAPSLWWSRSLGFVEGLDNADIRS